MKKYVYKYAENVKNKSYMIKQEIRKQYLYSLKIRYCIYKIWQQIKKISINTTKNP